MEKLQKIRIINMTGHPIKILESDSYRYNVKPRVKVEYPPEDIIIRAKHDTELIGVYEDQNGIPIQVTSTRYTILDNLPTPRKGVFYIVSKLIAELLFGTRDDLYIVSNKIYDKNGGVVGVRGLAKLNEFNYEGRKMV